MIRTLILGAGEAGVMLLREINGAPAISNRYLVVGFLDDAPKDRKVLGVSVLGRLADVKFCVAEYSIDQVIFAIPSADRSLVEKVLDHLADVDVRIRVVPGLYEIIAGSFSLNQIRDISPNDLLGREEVGFDIAEIQGAYKNKRVLVTGAGGSIGSELVRQVLNLGPRNVLALGHGENSIHELRLGVGADHRFDHVLADVRDERVIHKIFNDFRPDIIFHAAAHKHVYLMEKQPEEAVRSNVFGTFNCARAAMDIGAARFVLISTDKAVMPTSVMGATKRIAERVVLSLNETQSQTRFSLTRFGNVLGSRGSVVPKFQAQIAGGGPITLTHPEATRYFMSIREAARLVIKSATVDKGNVFVLDMGKPIKIRDLALRLIQLSGHLISDIPIVCTGLVQGEKLHEELAFALEPLRPTKYAKLLLSEQSQAMFELGELERGLSKLRDAIDPSFSGDIRKVIFDLV